MKAFILLALVIVSCSALHAKKLTTAQQSRIVEIKKGNSWGSILLNLAELHVMAKGPLDDLVAALEDTVADLRYKREKADAAFTKRTDEHVALVNRLEADIANCENDIDGLLDLLEMLAEQKAALEDENKRKLAENAYIRKDIRERTNVRQIQNEEFQTKVQETEEAVATVEECITILDDFQSGGASFAQVKKTTELLSKAQKKVAKVNKVEAAFLSALIQTAASQEFTDSGALNAVIGKFNEIKNNLYDSIGKLNADESLAQSEFNTFVGDSKATIVENETLVAQNNGLLEENAVNTEENTNLLYQRRADLLSFQEELEAEHVSYNDAQTRYENYCTENEREQAVCQEALEVVATADFADYLGDRINSEDGLVSSGMRNSKPHGQGTEVFNFDNTAPEVQANNQY